MRRYGQDETHNHMWIGNANVSDADPIDRSTNVRSEWMIKYLKYFNAVWCIYKIMTDLNDTARSPEIVVQWEAKVKLKRAENEQKRKSYIQSMFRMRWRTIDCGEWKTVEKERQRRPNDKKWLASFENKFPFSIMIDVWHMRCTLGLVLVFAARADWLFCTDTELNV